MVLSRLGLKKACTFHLGLLKQSSREIHLLCRESNSLNTIMLWEHLDHTDKPWKMRHHGETNWAAPRCQPYYWVSYLGTNYYKLINWDIPSHLIANCSAEPFTNSWFIKPWAKYNGCFKSLNCVVLLCTNKQTK